MEGFQIGGNKNVEEKFIRGEDVPSIYQLLRYIQKMNIFKFEAEYLQVVNSPIVRLTIYEHRIGLCLVLNEVLGLIIVKTIKGCQNYISIKEKKNIRSL